MITIIGNLGVARLRDESEFVIYYNRLASTLVIRSISTDSSKPEVVIHQVSSKCDISLLLMKCSDFQPGSIINLYKTDHDDIDPSDNLDDHVSDCTTDANVDCNTDEATVKCVDDTLTDSTSTSLREYNIADVDYDFTINNIHFTIAGRSKWIGNRVNVPVIMYDALPEHIDSQTLCRLYEASISPASTSIDDTCIDVLAISILQNLEYNRLQYRNRPKIKLS